VTINGARVAFNAGGSPGSGTGAAPLLPIVSEIPAVPPCPCVECIRQAADDGEAFVDEEDA
jgi:type VI secretion system secreted protein VgrG